MTSLISWVGADSRGPSSVYFASDSPITWPGAGKWDHGRKLFACRRYPHIFGYCGDVLFPTQTLSQIAEMIDSGLIAADPFDSIDSYTEKIVAIIETAFNTYPQPTKQNFDVLYCMREGELMRSRFHLRQITFDQASAPKVLPIEIPNQSGSIAVLGSGSKYVQDQLHLWESSQVGGTSRSVFSAFCDALRSGNDPLSGGPPQLVGLRRMSTPKTFGVIWQQRRYFYGLETGTGAAQNGVHWFNDLFEICDPETLGRTQDAQPQPRPKGR